MTFTLPDLPYEHGALAPHIDEATMQIHHGKHHQAYIDKANAALKGTDWENASTKEILTDLNALPEDIRDAARNNVGGHCNHTFFWLIMSPHGGGNPTGNLSTAIDSTFGSFDKFKESFANAAASRFGSGWAWLVLDKEENLKVISTANQDSPLSLGYTRVLGLDVWEHAYYLNYQNKRPDYVSAFWEVVNWEQAEDWFNQGGV